MAKTHRKRDHEPHMRPRERMHGLFIGLIFPPHGKRMFFVSLKIRSGYRRGEEMLAYLS
jgi:hypothetical protein